MTLLVADTQTTEGKENLPEGVIETSPAAPTLSDSTQPLPLPWCESSSTRSRSGLTRGFTQTFAVQQPSATSPQSVFPALLTPQHRVLPIKNRPVVHASNQAAIALLRKWRSDDADEGEQRETLELLKKALDQDRPSNRKLFP